MYTQWYRAITGGRGALAASMCPSLLCPTAMLQSSAGYTDPNRNHTACYQLPVRLFEPWCSSRSSGAIGSPGVVVRSAASTGAVAARARLWQNKTLSDVTLLVYPAGSAGDGFDGTWAGAKPEPVTVARLPLHSTVLASASPTHYGGLLQRWWRDHGQGKAPAPAEGAAQDRHVLLELTCFPGEPTCVPEAVLRHAYTGILPDEAHLLAWMMWRADQLHMPATVEACLAKLLAMANDGKLTAQALTECRCLPAFSTNQSTEQRLTNMADSTQPTRRSLLPHANTEGSPALNQRAQPTMVQPVPATSGQAPSTSPLVQGQTPPIAAATSRVVPLTPLRRRARRALIPTTIATATPRHPPAGNQPAASAVAVGLPQPPAGSAAACLAVAGVGFPPVAAQGKGSAQAELPDLDALPAGARREGHSAQEAGLPDLDALPAAQQQQAGVKPKQATAVNKLPLEQWQQQWGPVVGKVRRSLET